MDADLMFVLKYGLFSIVLWLITISFITFVIARPKRFFKDMPKDILKKGEFIPYTFKRFVMRDGLPKYSKKKYKILLFAYLKARFLACKLDFLTKGEECGVIWGIHEVEKDKCKLK